MIVLKSKDKGGGTQDHQTSRNKGSCFLTKVVLCFITEDNLTCNSVQCTSKPEEYDDLIN